MRRQPPRFEVDLRPLTARSVVLSALLGAHPPELPVKELVRFADDFDISDSALRVALTRMVAAADLQREGSVYRLSGRLAERQRLQDDAIHPLTTAWDGTWEMGAVTATGRTAADRAALRVRLEHLRMAELREGLWLRPANLARPWPVDLDDVVERFEATPRADQRDLTRSLWDLDGWAEAAGTLLRRFQSPSSPAERFTVAAAMVRMLASDPVLPEPLHTTHPWPADALRTAYRSYQDELVSLVTSHQAT